MAVDLSSLTALRCLAASVAVAPILLSACGEAQRTPAPVATPVGRGARFMPASLGPGARRGQTIDGLRCGRARAARFGVHLELFAQGRVVVVPAGVGVAPPRREHGAYVRGGRCSYPLRTREPTGVIEVALGTRATLADFFAVWGQPLAAHVLAGFRAADRQRVRAYVGGRRHRESVGSIALERHAEIVLELGPYVLPHTAYRFAPGL